MKRNLCTVAVLMITLGSSLVTHATEIGAVRKITYVDPKGKTLEVTEKIFQSAKANKISFTSPELSYDSGELKWYEYATKFQKATKSKEAFSSEANSQKALLITLALLSQAAAFSANLPAFLLCYGLAIELGATTEFQSKKGGCTKEVKEWADKNIPYSIRKYPSGSKVQVTVPMEKIVANLKAIIASK